MQNLHDDKHMDDLSRQAAEAYQPDQDLHSWESLRPQLEAALPQKKERKRRFLVIFFLFLLIGGGLVFSTVWNKTRESGGNNKLVEKPAGSNSSSKSTSTKAATPVTEQKTSATTETPDTKIDESAEPPVILLEKTIIPMGKSSSTVNNKSIYRTARATQRNTSTNTKNNDVTTEKPLTTTFEDRKIDPAVARIENLSQQIRLQFEQAPLLPIPPTTKKDKTKQSTPLKNRWEFAVAYAPDVSTVRFTHTQKPGNNVGLTIAYNISKRFAIQTGALYTTKNYKSYGKDYHPPKGYWTDYVDLKTVTADCNMWDIPLNLRYNLAPRRSSNLFASAGISSYLMREENYNYFYYYNGNPVNRARTYYTDTKHWMSVVNLSVAYERQVSRNIAIQAEPFFKQPLKGLGFGSVKLNTTGIYFSVKYKPLTAAGREAKKLR